MIYFFSWDVFFVNPVIFGCYHDIPPPKVRLLSNKFGPGSLLDMWSHLFLKKKEKKKEPLFLWCCILGDNMVGTFVGIIPSKPSREFTRPLGSPRSLKRLVAYAKCNRTSHERRIYLVVFQFYFLFCIAKGLAICKFRGVISIECCTFKPLNLYILIP